MNFNMKQSCKTVTSSLSATTRVKKKKMCMCVGIFGCATFLEIDCKHYLVKPFDPALYLLLTLLGFHSSHKELYSMTIAQ